jgi:ABC-2 type transport system ATP-binding protein
MPGVIEIRGLGKRYWKLEERAKLSQSVLPFVRPRREELWALRNIDLQVAAGETIGVMGHNGAGKTTMLRLLAGVTRPTEGRVRVVGRIAPLISLGVGFHQEMSGRENVLVNGMLLGLTAQQVAERFDSIVEFAELEDFIDTPVKFYSSGMFMRLGFAVVVHVDPTILLVDEILAVGDAGFQLKCFERLRSLQQQGAAIVVVSHSLHTIRQLCRRAVLINHGRLIYDGDVERAIAMHYESMSGETGQAEQGHAIEVRERRLMGELGESHHANYDEHMELVLGLLVRDSLEEFDLTFTIQTDSGYPAMSHHQAIVQDGGGFAAGEHVSLRLSFRARLGGGNYMLTIVIRSPDGRLLGRAEGLLMFVAGRPSSIGVVELDAEFAVDGIDRTDRRTMMLEY